MDKQAIKSKGGKPPRGVGPDREGRLEDLFKAIGLDVYTDGPSVIGKGNRPAGQWKGKTVADIIKMTKVKVEEVDIQESGHTDVPSMKTQVQIAMDLSLIHI